MLEELKANLAQAQNLMKQQANKHRRNVQFELGDQVYLKIQPYKLQTLAKRTNQKLSPRYYGPFEVVGKISPVAYKLQLPEGCLIHPVFHISLLKKSLAPTVQVQPLPHCLSEEWELQVEPAAVLDSRLNPFGETELLVSWKNLPDFENSWESLQQFQNQFPTFHLEDKVFFPGGSDDRNLISSKSKDYSKVYKRRGKVGINISPTTLGE